MQNMFMIHPNTCGINMYLYVVIYYHTEYLHLKLKQYVIILIDGDALSAKLRIPYKLILTNKNMSVIRSQKRLAERKPVV